MAQDLFSTLRSYASKVSSGEKSAAEVSAAFAAWAKESGEGIKDKVEIEIESALLKMGFIRKTDISPLIKRIDELERAIGKKPAAPKKSPKKIIKKTVKKAAASKIVRGK
jgi:hypothetical protein